MNRAWLWFVLSCKRYVRRLSFLLILLILPLAVLGIRTAEEDGATEIRVSVYAEGSENAALGGGTGGGAEKAAEELPLEQALAPVSYTHLDVYKRQALTGSMRRLRLTTGKRSWC